MSTVSLSFFCICVQKKSSTETALDEKTPPHVWGKHLFRRCFATPLRITPTRVGKTKPTLRSIGSATGSPPLVWGNTKRMPLNQRFRLVKIRFLITFVFNDYIIILITDNVNAFCLSPVHPAFDRSPPAFLGMAF